ncbi:tRNA (adenine(22)-N(1))-methyltransferase [Motilimonas eburnea]|uniref:tRNA (adenine(22)-N(1))-methyltransferase n=1 Tax=Motilimonas eburnea TaxID=1737488 RepID=UPI001E429CE8|nr:tRNA (adenine(22)-N(1))-methyltransferase TrmK [Motilimonas eburnea]MCE2571985.1 tRNA (adenine(22)-N(1))-methyltransferase TrmK [Motilimonas eburnea]
MAKLGLRLKAIAKQVTFSGQPIWDCCCDHGYLGQYLLEQDACIQTGSVVNFVDCIADIIAQLNTRLSQITALQGRWQSHCIDVAKLPLAEQTSLSHTIIIAGVGGELTAKMVTALNQQFAKHKLEFILCPVHHEYEMRTALAQQGLRLFDEQLVKENGRFYEILRVGCYGQDEITPTGKKLWHRVGPIESQYLATKIKHYQRLGLGGQDTAGIISAYAVYLD